MDKDFNLEQMEKETEKMLRLRYITKENGKFARTEGGFVSLNIEGEEYKRVQVYRTFPFTDKNHYISIRESDEKAREIGIIKDLEKDVTKETVKMLEEQMNLRYFTPIIEKVIDIKDEYGFACFHVKTNHGICNFTIHMGRGSVVNITDTRKLSSSELKMIDLFL